MTNRTLSNTVANEKMLAPEIEVSRQGRRSNGNGGPNSMYGAFSCSTCGRPVRSAHEALQREQRLVKRLLEENEAFRQSLSNEIYEGFNQQLVGALLHLQGFEQMQEKYPAEAQVIFRAGVELLRDTLDEARRIANRLKPPVLDDFGIAEGVNYLIGEMCRFGGPKIEFLRNGDLENISTAMKNAAFRIVQELLGNACNHSGSRQVRLEMTRDGQILHIKVEDWGIGFDPAKVADDYFGLRKIRERVRLLGGRAIVHSAPGKGTRIVVELPISNAG